jgi:hypothetical protein
MPKAGMSPSAKQYRVWCAGGYKKGKLATMDRAILASLPEEGRDREFVELL